MVSRIKVGELLGSVFTHVAKKKLIEGATAGKWPSISDVLEETANVTAGTLIHQIVGEKDEKENKP